MWGIGIDDPVRRIYNAAECEDRPLTMSEARRVGTLLQSNSYKTHARLFAWARKQTGAETPAEWKGTRPDLLNLIGLLSSYRRDANNYVSLYEAAARAGDPIALYNWIKYLEEHKTPEQENLLAQLQLCRKTLGWNPSTETFDPPVSYERTISALTVHLVVSTASSSSIPSASSATTATVAALS